MNILRGTLSPTRQRPMHHHKSAHRARGPGQVLRRLVRPTCSDDIQGDDHNNDEDDHDGVQRFVWSSQTIFKVVIMKIVVIIMMRVTRLSCQKLFKVMIKMMIMTMTMLKDLFVWSSQKIFKAQQRARESGSSAEEKKPWFTYLSFQSVHDPLQVAFPIWVKISHKWFELRIGLDCWSYIITVDMNHADGCGGNFENDLN